MKKIIFLLLTALMMVGCDLNPEGATRIDDVYYSINVDSCEYIICKGNLRGHKGNCHFCEKRDSIKWEKRKKELKELIMKSKENNYDARRERITIERPLCKIAI